MLVEGKGDHGGSSLSSKNIILARGKERVEMEGGPYLGLWLVVIQWWLPRQEDPSYRERKKTKPTRSDPSLVRLGKEPT